VELLDQHDLILQGSIQNVPSSKINRQKIWKIKAFGERHLEKKKLL
jgi:hypothetical protein